MATIVTQHSDKPNELTGRQWRRLRSHMRRQGEGRLRAFFRFSWRAAREGNNRDFFPDRQHDSDIARRAAAACHKARLAG